MARAAAKKKAPAAEKPPEPKKRPNLTLIDCEQLSEDWYRARLGIPTASKFATVMALGGDDGEDAKTRSRYLHQLAGEILTGLPTEDFQSQAMERGRRMEVEAREDFEKRSFAKLTQVGFGVNRGLMKIGVAGASPDALIADDGGFEAKSMKPELMIPLLRKGAGLPPQFRAQCHGGMWVFERSYWILKIYWPGMPNYEVRVERDDKFIAEIARAVETFNWELKKLVGDLCKMGATRAITAEVLKW